MYMCPKCHKIYKQNGLCIKKHLIEKCHVFNLNPIKLHENNDIDTIVNLVLEKLKIVKSTDSNIIRIKKENSKYISTVKIDFTEVIKEMKAIFNENFNYKEYLKPIEILKSN